MLTCFSGKLADIFIYLLGTLQRVFLALGGWLLAFPAEIWCRLTEHTCKCSSPQTLSRMCSQLRESRKEKNLLSIIRANGEQKEFKNNGSSPKHIVSTIICAWF